MKQEIKNIVIILISIIIFSNSFPSYPQYSEIKYQHLTVDDGLSQNTVRFIEQDIYGFIWFGTFHGLNRYDGYDFKIYRMDPADPNSLSSNRIQTTYLDSLGNLWIETPDGIIHLYHYESDNFTRYKPGQAPPYVASALLIQENSIKDFIFKNHRFSFRYGSEINRLFEYTDLNTGEKTICKVNPFDPTSLHDNYILDIFLDQSNMLWVSTFSSGVSVADLNRKSFFQYKKNLNDAEGFIDNNIRPIYQDEEGILWIGTRDKGITRFDRKKNTYKHYQHDPNRNSLVGNDVRCIYKDSEGYMWFGTKQGLDYFDPVNEVFYNVIKGNENIHWVFGVNEDSHKNLWICSFGGLYKYDRKNNRMKIYNQEDSTIIHNYLRFIHEDPYGFLWVGSENGGITRLKKLNSQDEFEDIFESRHYFHIPSDTNSLSSNRVYVMCEDEKEKLWFGTGNGINIYNRETGSFDHVTMEDGLANDMIVGLLSDKNGYVWASHKRGISRIDINTLLVKNYDTHDGLQDKEFNEDAYFFNPKTREMFFGGPNGINFFFPDSIKENTIVPMVYITKIEINDKTVNINEKINDAVILTKNVLLTNEIKLNHKHKRIAIEFTGIHYSNPKKNQFKYMLEGFDNKWVETTANSRRAVYSNLKPKKYTFKVMASNQDGIWNETPTTLTIIMYPPWWKTWWFRTLILLIAVGGAVSFYYVRMNQLKKQKRQLEKKVGQRTKEIKQANELLEKQKKSIEKSLNTIKTLSGFGQQLTATLDLHDINKMVFEYVSSLMDTTNFGIGIYDEKNETIVFNSFIEKGKPLDAFYSPLSDKTSCGVWCFLNQKMIFSNHFLEEYLNYIESLKIRTSETPKSIIYHPLATKKKQIGIVTVQSNKEEAYTDYDKAIIQNLASYISIALDNAHMYQELAIKNDELTNQTYILNETNTLLEERQQLIEEQSEELKAKTEELSHNNAMLSQLVATKDKFFSIIAHDLKNPFSSILGFVELLKYRYNKFDDTKRMMFIHSIHNSTSNLFALLENLLQWSRSQTGSIEYHPMLFNINDVITDNIKLANNMIQEKGIVVETNITDKSIVYADIDMINTVVRNLIANAIKFTDKGKISIDTKKSRGCITTYIKDTGKGIEKEKLDNLFDIGSNKSTKGTRGESGTGLGLIICKEFVQKNGGDIHVESIEGEGSTFYFSLPVSNHSDTSINSA